jgi:branched-subunit amino acid ABC-type transport system permease component
VVGFFLLLAYSGGSDYVKKEINKRFKTNENLSNFLAIFIFSFLAFIVLFIIVELVFILDIFNVFKFSITEGNYTEVDLFNNYVFILIMFFVTVGIMAFIAFSRLGDIFLSIREDEEAAESLGINVTKYKILAFSISAFFAGIAGGLYTQLLNVIGPSYFDSTISFKIVIMVIIGGIGTIYGGVLGSFIINFLSFLFLDTVFKKISGMEIFVLGALLIFVLLYLKSGIVRAKKDEKKAIVIGILLAISWTILANIDIFSIPDIVLQFALFVLGILTLPAIPIFIIGEEIGLFVFNNIMSLNLSPGEQLIKGKFLIYIVCGIPYALYLPKIFKKARIKFWGIWPSIGIYEPEN